MCTNRKSVCYWKNVPSQTGTFNLRVLKQRKETVCTYLRCLVNRFKEIPFTNGPLGNSTERTHLLFIPLGADWWQFCGVFSNHLIAFRSFYALSDLVTFAGSFRRSCEAHSEGSPKTRANPRSRPLQHPQLLQQRKFAMKTSNAGREQSATEIRINGRGGRAKRVWQTNE